MKRITLIFFLTLLFVLNSKAYCQINTLDTLVINENLSINELKKPINQYKYKRIKRIFNKHESSEQDPRSFSPLYSNKYYVDYYYKHGIKVSYYRSNSNVIFKSRRLFSGFSIWDLQHAKTAVFFSFFPKKELKDYTLAEFINAFEINDKKDKIHKELINSQKEIDPYREVILYSFFYGNMVIIISCEVGEQTTYDELLECKMSSIRINNFNNYNNKAYDYIIGQINCCFSTNDSIQKKRENKTYYSLENAINYSNYVHHLFIAYIKDKKNIKLVDSIANCKNLTHLTLSSSKIKKIPENLGTLNNLQRLSISTSSNELPTSISNLNSLTSFSIYGNPLLEKIPESIGKITTLKSLQIISNKNIKTLPNSIGDLRNLEKLSLSRNSLSSLPDSISKLENLIFLTISENNFKSFPKAICGLKNLKVLSLPYNEIKTVPEEIKQLTSLERLELCGNKFTKEELVRIQELLPNCKIITNDCVCY